ncbi:related to endo-1,3(4)-beta-glucanase [Ustilago bromivora]|uniref:Related to endo-1,3(4)-beta-glucanase n=1 Tax=Ustilago bromivora TaxID=307758 RepID=A0A1K0G8U3_9BASI|nr:related to endo-1,3(4)-beta-glucanase [Ustilago bromivora]SYW79485.1 related to endo-1,3(4)-beta-glucanase [Ustilago bromivora]
MVNITVKLTLMVQAALLLLALQNAPAPAMGFFGCGRPVGLEAGAGNNDGMIIPREAHTAVSAVFEHAYMSAKREPPPSSTLDDDEDDEYDELEIITIFLPEEGEEEEDTNPLHKRAGPTPCPAQHTRRQRRELAAQTAHPGQHDKRDPQVKYRTRTRTVTLWKTRTIYETVYRRCTQYVKRATTTQRRTTSTKRKTTSTKRRSTSTRKPTTTSKRRSTTSTRRATTTSKRTTSTSSRSTTSTSSRRTTSTTPKPASTTSKRTTSTPIKSATTSVKTTSTTPKPVTTSSTSIRTTSTTPKPVTTRTTSTRRSSSSTTSTKSSRTSTRSTSTWTSSSSSTNRAITTSSSSTRSVVVPPTTRSSSTATTWSSTTISSSSTTTSSSSSSTVTAAPTPKVYNLMADYKGANFYDNMYFFTFKDPTKGLVDFVGKDEASSSGLIKTTNGGQVYMGYATYRVYPAVSTAVPPMQRRQISSSSSASSTSTVSFVSMQASTTTSSPTGTVSSTTSSTSTSNSASTTTSAAPIPYMKSIRISSFDSFTTGVFILDASHMPVGCGIWPSWWTVPTNPAGGWPNGGEIDIVEGIGYTNQNTYSVHTVPGCRVNLTTNAQRGNYQLSNVTLATNCASSETGNKGCGVQSSLRTDFGAGYNSNGGGIHAMVWDKDLGIKSWFFPRTAAPADIAAGKPDPSGWGTPQGSWPAQDCDPTKFFFNHVSVFSNTICGEWAGDKQLWNNAWNGQKQSCAAMTGYSSCQAYVQSKDVDFSEAYWLINSVKVYQTQRTK